MFRCGEPGRGAGREVEIRDDDFVIRRQIERAGEQVIGLRAAGAEGDLIRGESKMLRSDLAAGLDARILRTRMAERAAQLASLARERPGAETFMRTVARA